MLGLMWGTDPNGPETRMKLRQLAEQAGFEPAEGY